ncbi:MAG: response regulator [Planctomycetes bacterium]|jgi:two-component system chemotaxis response regulator CheY|nr:response regulator [Planctomycetota bacterium]MCC7065999.1 response regulator [Planctomycetota bacterium]
MRILIVEDDFISRKVLSHFLAGFGEVITAEDGQKGLDLLMHGLTSERPFDLVTLDVMMPEIDGQEVLAKLRALESVTNGPRARVLMTTALEDMKSVKEAYENLCDAYLKKPVRKAVLYGTLQKLGYKLP